MWTTTQIDEVIQFMVGSFANYEYSNVASKVFIAFPILFEKSPKSDIYPVSRFCDMRDRYVNGYENKYINVGTFSSIEKMSNV